MRYRDVKQIRRRRLLSFAFLARRLRQSANAPTDSAAEAFGFDKYRTGENSESGKSHTRAGRALRQRKSGHRAGSRIFGQRRRHREKSLLGRGVRRENFFLALGKLAEARRNRKPEGKRFAANRFQA